MDIHKKIVPKGMNPELLLDELVFQTARSGGAGGQHVNKVESKVELRFDIANSAVLTEEARQRLIEKLANKITNDGVLVITHQTERSQYANKQKVIKKFNALIKKAFEVDKPRKPTKPTAAMVEKRLKTKQRASEMKVLRRRVDLGED